MFRFPALAVESDGRIHFVPDERRLESISELLIHGDISLIVDVDGIAYDYISGDFQDSHIRAASDNHSEDAIDAVWVRIQTLSESSSKHHHELLTRNLSTSEILDVKDLPDSRLGAAFILSALLRLD